MQTIGERLEEARKKKGISIREAAEATKIRGDYLQKFESNQFDIGLTEIYTRGFLRTYSNYLKLPADRILNDYAGLGRGDVRPRQPNREIYGRMDISVSSAGESSERAAPPAENAPAAEPAPAPARAQQPRYPRGGGTPMPAGLDPALVFKYLKWGGGAIIVIIILLIIKSCYSDRTPASTSSTARTASPAAPTTTARPAPAGRSYKLIATDFVRVYVRKQIDENTEGDDVIPPTTMSPGQVLVVPWNEAQFLWYSSGEALKLETSSGQRSDMPQPGTNRIFLRAPR